MNGNSAVSALNSSLSNSALQTQRQVAVAKMGMDAQRFEGEAVVKLIQNATIDPSVGRDINTSA